MIGNVPFNTAGFLLDTCYITRQISGHSHSPTKLGLLWSLILSANDSNSARWYQIKIPKSRTILTVEIRFDTHVGLQNNDDLLCHDRGGR